MKKIFVFSLIILFAGLFSYSQTTSVLSQDEQLRVKQAVHLLTYDTIGAFESAVGEAYFTLVINSFKENLTIPKINTTSIPANDKAKVEGIISKLNQLLQQPPSWDELLAAETQYQIWRDKALRRVSKYKK